MDKTLNKNIMFYINITQKACEELTIVAYVHVDDHHEVAEDRHFTIPDGFRVFVCT